MKQIITLLILLFTIACGKAQNFTGQWKGEFIDQSSSFVGWGGDHCEYVLELECRGSVVTGYSYTYFSEAGKRYYTICRLTGSLNKQTKTVKVREVERTKTNVPDNIRNCFQVHTLNFYKDGNEEKLEGNWVPAPNQEGDCGYGQTVLSRRVLTKIAPKFNTTSSRISKPPVKKMPDLRDPNKKQVTATVKKPVVTPPLVKKPVTEKTKADPISPVPVPEVKKETARDITLPVSGYEKRNNSLIKTIELDNDNFKVDLYDNGDIDGDSISLFYNGKLILSHKRLSDKPLSITLNADNNKEVNELIMYAENLGEFPPNTALMVVTDGVNRYEVRITSDLQKSGAIRFVHKQKTQ